VGIENITAHTHELDAIDFFRNTVFRAEQSRMREWNLVSSMTANLFNFFFSVILFIHGLLYLTVGRLMKMTSIGESIFLKDIVTVLGETLSVFMKMCFISHYLFSPDALACLFFNNNNKKVILWQMSSQVKCKSSLK